MNGDQINKFYKMEIKEKTIKDILNILKPYHNGCVSTSTNRAANFMQRNGAKTLGVQIEKVIKDIEGQI